MNRVEFMAELERLLADLPEDERQAAVQYYADYFADAGAENEAEVIRELGSPEKTAESIKADYYGRTFDESRFEHKDYMEKYGQQASGQQTSGQRACVLPTSHFVYARRSTHMRLFSGGNLLLMLRIRSRCFKRRDVKEGGLLGSYCRWCPSVCDTRFRTVEDTIYLAYLYMSFTQVRCRSQILIVFGRML